MKELDLVYRTIFAELMQRSIDASFASEYPIQGRFVTVTVGGRKYWYFDLPQQSTPKRKYVGPHSDDEITARVDSFKLVKDDFKARRKLVSTLIREAGLAPPERLTGDVVEALAAAGFFRLRGVLVGTVAFQCYAGLLGIKLPAAAMQTSDADFAQFHSISAAVEDTLPPVLDVVKAVDPSFREIRHQIDGRQVTAFENRTRYRVEFLTPNRGSAAQGDRPTEMPALGRASAQPLRFLDFLIYEPVRSVMLHKSGVAVTVPAPERYAVHKLIISSRRRSDPNGDAKRSKDVRQADLLIEALALTRRQADLALAYSEAWRRGPSWRAGITFGLSNLQPKRSELARNVLHQGLRDIGENPDAFSPALAEEPTG